MFLRTNIRARDGAYAVAGLPALDTKLMQSLGLGRLSTPAARSHGDLVSGRGGVRPSVFRLGCCCSSTGDAGCLSCAGGGGGESEGNNRGFLGRRHGRGAARNHQFDVRVCGGVVIEERRVCWSKRAIHTDRQARCCSDEKVGDAPQTLRLCCRLVDVY